MKTAIFIDLSPSFVDSEHFDKAIKQIMAKLYCDTKNELEFYGFAKNVHELTRADLFELESIVESGKDSIERAQLIYKIANDVLQSGTFISGIKEKLKTLSQSFHVKAIIYSDFCFYDDLANL